MIDRNSYSLLSCPQCLARHGEILRQLGVLKDSELARRSHFFAGRFENLYLPREHMPALACILDTALAEAACLLERNAETLQLGFWFNIMQQGDVTLAHSHDDDDELLSATYYFQTPPGSGKLLLTLSNGPCSIDPVEGNFVFFHPAVIHEVSAHDHPSPRISLGLNIGPRKFA